MNEETETLYHLAEAEISVHPDLGCITLCLVRREMRSGKPEHLPGLRHRLHPTQAEDLIAHLQQALANYRARETQPGPGSNPH